MSSSDNLQSLLAKYRAAPQIQAAVNTALAQAKLSASKEGMVAGAGTTSPLVQSTPSGLSIPAQPQSASNQAAAIPDRAEATMSLHEIKDRLLAPAAAPSNPLPLKENTLSHYKGKHSASDHVENLLPPSPSTKKQSTETASKTVKIMETVEHYKSEPQHYLETRSVETQTPRLLTEDNEVVQRLQGELNYMKTQLSCLQTEVIKQFLKIDNKLSALLARQS